MMVLHSPLGKLTLVIYTIRHSKTSSTGTSCSEGTVFTSFQGLTVTVPTSKMLLWLLNLTLGLIKSVTWMSHSVKKWGKRRSI